jgi:hypothetical protein
VRDEIFQKFCVIFKESFSELNDYQMCPEHKLLGPPYLKALDNRGPEGLELGLTVLQMTIEDEFGFDFTDDDFFASMRNEKRFFQMTLQDLVELIEKYLQAKV